MVVTMDSASATACVWYLHQIHIKYWLFLTSWPRTHPERAPYAPQVETHTRNCAFTIIIMTGISLGAKNMNHQSYTLVLYWPDVEPVCCCHHGQFWVSDQGRLHLGTPSSRWIHTCMGWVWPRGLVRISAKLTLHTDKEEGFWLVRNNNTLIEWFCHVGLIVSRMSINSINPAFCIVSIWPSLLLNLNANDSANRNCSHW